jgi:2-oxoglutarate dehydrogenase E2 component (dihydrolipoamide succinyltransferase)
MSFFVKASVACLQEIPAVNAAIDGNQIIYRDYCDISIAVATPNGLMVPVLRNCESKSFADIEKVDQSPYFVGAYRPG